MTVTIFAAFYVASAAAIVGWVGLFFQRRDKRLEKQARLKAEQKQAHAESELATIRRRSLELRPYLGVSDRRFNGVQFESSQPGRDIWLSAIHPNLLCSHRDQVPSDLPAGQAVVLALENEGQRAVEAIVTVAGAHAQLIEPVNAEAAGLLLLSYPYRPDQHGKEEVVELSFLAVSGVRDTQRYITKHGHAFLWRIDPA